MSGVIIVDDFYKNPSEARLLGLNCEYLPSGAGVDGEVCIESKKSYFSESFVSKLESLIDHKISFDPAKYAFGVFAKAELKDRSRSRVHIDPTDWVGIIYLNDEINQRGGTTIYKHIETGFEKLPTDTECINMGIPNQNFFKQEVLRRDSKKMECWSPIMTIEKKFNRLLLIRANELFHKASGYFGESAETARLTQLFFFNEKK